MATANSIMGTANFMRRLLTRDANQSDWDQNYDGFEFDFDFNCMVSYFNLVPTRNLLDIFDFEKIKYIEDLKIGSEYSLDYGFES